MPKKIDVLAHTNKLSYTSWNAKQTLKDLDEARSHIMELEKAYNDLVDYVTKMESDQSVKATAVDPAKLDKLPSNANRRI